MADGFGSALDVDVRRRYGSYKVTLAGELTAETTPALVTALRNALRTGPIRIKIDFAGVAAMQDDGLFAIFGLYRRAQGQGTRIVLMRVPAHVRRQFDDTLLAELLTFR